MTNKIPLLICLILMPFSQASAKIILESDTATISKKDRIGHYSGRVKFRHDNMLITSEQAKTFVDENYNLTKATATSQKKFAKLTHYDEKTKSILFTAIAKLIEYFPEKKLVYLKGDAKVERGGETFVANVISYDLINRIIHTPAQKNKRTTIYLNPKSDSSIIKSF